MENNFILEARSALDKITRHGYRSSIVDKDALKYGLEHAVFDQSAIDVAKENYQGFIATKKH